MNWLRRKKVVATYPFPITPIEYQLTLMVFTMSLPDVSHKLIVMKANSLFK